MQISGLLRTDNSKRSIGEKVCTFTFISIIAMTAPSAG